MVDRNAKFLVEDETTVFNQDHPLDVTVTVVIPTKIAASDKTQRAIVIVDDDFSEQVDAWCCGSIDTTDGQGRQIDDGLNIHTANRRHNAVGHFGSGLRADSPSPGNRQVGHRINRLGFRLLKLQRERHLHVTGGDSIG